MLLAVGFVHLLAQQVLAVGKGVDQQPFDMGGLQHFARPLLVVGDGGGQGLCQVVIDNLDFFAFQFAQIHFQVASSTMSVR